MAGSPSGFRFVFRPVSLRGRCVADEAHPQVRVNGCPVLRAKTTPKNLREDVALHSLTGGGRVSRGAARQFEVSDSCSVKLLARVERTGSAAPARQGRLPGGGKLAAHLDFLIAIVEQTPDMTMPELAARLAAERGVSANLASLSRVPCAAGFSFKNVWPGPVCKGAVVMA